MTFLTKITFKFNKIKIHYLDIEGKIDYKNMQEHDDWDNFMENFSELQNINF